MTYVKRDLTGKTAVVTGGNRGIGRAISWHWRKKGPPWQSISTRMRVRPRQWSKRS